MKLFQLVTGATYWVAANDPDEVICTVREYELLGNTTQDVDEDLAEATPVELTEAQARKITVHDDETGGDVSLWDLGVTATKPEIIACSEWA